MLQECELDPLLTVREAVALFAAFYSAPRPVEETIELVGLAEKRDARIGTLSGGQKRRVDVAIGIIGDPDLIFLDEPTTGFDPTARRDAWNMIEGLKELGKTVFLTTHYMDEAQHLADRVAILRDGEIVAQGATGGARREPRPHDRDRLPPQRRARRRGHQLRVSRPGRARQAARSASSRAAAAATSTGCSRWPRSAASTLEEPRGAPAEPRGHLPRADHARAPEP